MTIFYKAVLWAIKLGVTFFSVVKSDENMQIKKAIYGIAYQYTKTTETIVDDVALKILAESIGLATMDMTEEAKEKVQEGLNKMQIGPIKGLEVDLKKGVGVKTDFGNINYSLKDGSVRYTLGTKL